MAKSKMQFNTTVLQAKEELMHALDAGMIKSSAYNTLNDEEKEFVKLVVFGGHPGHKAIQEVKPGISDPYAAANRMALRPGVAEVMEELTEKKDKYWLTKIGNSRDVALRKLEFIMRTTDDPVLAASCADKIISHANIAMKGNRQEQEAPGFNMVITVAPQVGQPQPQDVVTVDYAEITHKNYNPQ